MRGRSPRASNGKKIGTSNSRFSIRKYGRGDRAWVVFVDGRRLLSPTERPDLVNRSVVIGHPLFETDVAVRGSVLGPIRLGDGRKAIALDAPIFPGNSGSPVIAGDGTVVAGVFGTATIEDGSARRTIGLAAPIAALPASGARP